MGVQLLLCERHTAEGLLVSVCDREVLGKTFATGEITLTVTEEFYGGEVADEGAVLSSLAQASVANIVGSKSVELAIQHGYVHETSVLEVGETVHAQMLRLP